MVKLLGAGTPGGKENAAGALLSLAGRNPENQVAMVAAVTGSGG